MKSKKRG